MKVSKNPINLYNDTQLYNIKKIISIENEDDLNNFWNFLVTSENTAHTLINTFISHFYNFVLVCFDRKGIQSFNVILEENEQYFYFTIWNKKFSLLFKEYIQKTDLEYIQNKNRITIKLSKLKFEKNLQKQTKKYEKRSQKIVEGFVNNTTVKQREPYNFIDEDDLSELLKLNDDMQELVFKMKKYGLTEDIFISLRSLTSLFSLTLRYYKKIATIATTITDFSNLLNLHKEKFLLLSPEELHLLYGFIQNIDTWLQNLFVHGGVELYFMDNSMKADLVTISTILQISNHSINEDIESIFDF